MSLKKINQLFNFEKGTLQSSKCIEGEYNFITAAEEWKTHKEYSHDCEALIFAAAASGSLGRTHYVNGKFISSDLCFILTPKDPDKIPLDLKFYHIIFNLYKDEIVAATKAGTSKEAIGLKVFGEYELPYFEISIQKKVKEEFGKAEALKNKLFDEYSHQLTLISQLEQAILQEAVQGKLVPQDPNDEPASELLKRIKAEKATLRQAQGKGKKEKTLPPIKPEEIPFEIPENWVWCRLGEIISISSGDGLTSYQMDKSGNIPVYGGNGINGYHSKFNIDSKRIVIGRVGAYCGAVHITEDKGWVTDNAFIVSYSVENIDFNWLAFFLKALDLNKLSYKGNQPVISGARVYPLVVPLPPLSEQKRIVAEIEKQLAKTKQLKEHIIANQQATEQLLKALLHQAFEVKEMEEVNS